MTSEFPPPGFLPVYEEWLRACAAYNADKTEANARATHATWEAVLAIEPNEDVITDWEYATGRRVTDE